MSAYCYIKLILVKKKQGIGRADQVVENSRQYYFIKEIRNVFLVFWHYDSYTGNFVDFQKVKNTPLWLLFCYAFLQFTGCLFKSIQTRKTICCFFNGKRPWYTERIHEICKMKRRLQNCYHLTIVSKECINSLDIVYGSTIMLCVCSLAWQSSTEIPYRLFFILLMVYLR